MTVKKICLMLLLFLTIGILTGCESNTESGDIGYIQDEVNSEVPNELIGTWEASEGLPDGLMNYQLTIDENGQVTQTSQVEKGEPTTATATLSVDGDKITILDSNNTVLMTLNNLGDHLETHNLGESGTTFVKIR